MHCIFYNFKEIYCDVENELSYESTRRIRLLLDQCWASVVDAGPTLIRQWVNASSDHSECKHEDICIYLLGFIYTNIYNNHDNHTDMQL